MLSIYGLEPSAYCWVGHDLVRALLDEVATLLADVSSIFLMLGPEVWVNYGMV